MRYKFLSRRSFGGRSSSVLSSQPLISPSALVHFSKSPSLFVPTLKLNHGFSTAPSPSPALDPHALHSLWGSLAHSRLVCSRLLVSFAPLTFEFSTRRVSYNIFQNPTLTTPPSEIYLKLENLQPSGSFKSRGIGNLMTKAIARHAAPKSLDKISQLPTPTVSRSGTPSASNGTEDSTSSEPTIHFFSSSGGNAGLAAATSALSLGRPCTVVVPNSTTPYMISKIRAQSAEVIQVGANWFEADQFLHNEIVPKAQASGETPIYVPPFEHPDVWEGASYIVPELESDLAWTGGYDAVVCSVGGGGLFNGLMQGLEKNSQRFRDGKVRILAMETIGADSLWYALQAGELATLPKITSIATSLGATTVSPTTFKYASENQGNGRVVARTLSDAQAAMACVRFAEDDRMIVEPACGVSIAPIYTGLLRQELGMGMSEEQWRGMKVVVVVCGGSNVNADKLMEYRETYGGQV